MDCNYLNSCQMLAQLALRLYSLIFYPSILLLIGPEYETGNLEKLFLRKKRHDRVQRRSIISIENKTTIKNKLINFNIRNSFAEH